MDLKLTSDGKAIIITQDNGAKFSVVSEMVQPTLTRLQQKKIADNAAIDADIARYQSYYDLISGKKK